MESSDREQESNVSAKSSAETSDLPDNEIKEIHSFGAGLKSLLEAVDPSSFSKLEFLSLHDNDIDRMKGLENLLSLRELNLSSNRIKEMEGLSKLSQLQVLNLSCNQIEEIRDLQGLRALKTLVLSHNHVKSLCGLSALNGPRYSLRILDLRDNRVESLSELRVLAGCIYLKELSFSRGSYTNPICHAPGYKSSVIAATPHLHKLDGELISGPLPVNMSQNLPQFADKFQTYLAATVPSWVLEYASHGKLDPRYQDGESRYFPPYINSSDPQQEKALFTSQPQVSVLLKQQHVENKRQDDSRRRPCPFNPAHIDTSDGQHCTKPQPTTYSSCQQKLTRNLPPGSKSVEPYQAQEASTVQHDNVQALNWADEPSSTPFNGHPNLLEDASRGVNEDSDQDNFRTDEELEVGNFSSITDAALPYTDHSQRGFYRRRWPVTKSVLPSALLKKVEFSEVCDGGPLEALEARILHLVHELDLAKRGATWGLQALRAESAEMNDDHTPRVHRRNDCGGATARPTKYRKEMRSQCRDVKEESSSSDTSNTHELKTESTTGSRRRVRWSDEKSGRSESGDSSRRWMIFAKKVIKEMNHTKSDRNSKCEVQESGLQNVLQLLNEEVKHLHQAVVSLNSVPKIEETQNRLEEETEAMSKTGHDQKDTRDSKLQTESDMLEDHLAEAKKRFLEEKKELLEILEGKQQAVHELENIVKEKNEKLQGLLRQAKESFPSQNEDPALCPEDHIRDTIISVKAELFSMEKSLQKATVAEQSAKAALLNATADKENSKHLVISMYKALEEERANLKLCKSELDTCQSHCEEITQEHKKIKSELENTLEAKQKELALIKLLHKQEVESIHALGVELGKSQGLAMAEESSAQFRHNMREELSDIQHELHEARRGNVKVRQDMASLQDEHQREVAEFKEVIQSLILKEQNKDALILELSTIVRSQKAQLQVVNFDVEKLTAAEEELQRRQQELSSLRLMASRFEGLVEKVESLQLQLTEVSQDANVKAESERKLLTKLMALQQENTELASCVQKLQVSEDAVKIKNVMLESQNDRIRDLKKELLEAREAFNRVLMTSETLESEWIKRLQDEAEKGEDLRRELTSQALTMDNLEEKLKVERVAKLAAEKTSKFLQQKVEEKEEMLRYVEDEISQVKTLYDNKVRVIAVERDQAMEELNRTLKDMEQTKGELSAEAQKSRELLEARKSLQNQVEGLKAKISEKDFQLSEAARRVLQLEKELDCQTHAMERQRTVASSKVEQLRRILEDLGDLK